MHFAPRQVQLWETCECNRSPKLSLRGQVAPPFFLQPCWETLLLYFLRVPFLPDWPTWSSLSFFLPWSRLSSQIMWLGSCLSPLTSPREMWVLGTPDVPPASMHRWRDAFLPEEHCRHSHRHDGLVFLFLTHLWHLLLELTWSSSTWLLPLEHGLQRLTLLSLKNTVQFLFTTSCSEARRSYTGYVLPTHDIAIVLATACVFRKSWVSDLAR